MSNDAPPSDHPPDCITISGTLMPPSSLRDPTYYSSNSSANFSSTWRRRLNLSTAYPMLRSSSGNLTGIYIQPHPYPNERQAPHPGQYNICSDSCKIMLYCVKYRSTTTIYHILSGMCKPPKQGVSREHPCIEHDPTFHAIWYMSPIWTIPHDTHSPLGSPRRTAAVP